MRCSLDAFPVATLVPLAIIALRVEKWNNPAVVKLPLQSKISCITSNPWFLVLSGEARPFFPANARLHPVRVILRHKAPASLSFFRDPIEHYLNLPYRSCLYFNTRRNQWCIYRVLLMNGKEYPRYFGPAFPWTETLACLLQSGRTKRDDCEQDIK